MTKDAIDNPERVKEFRSRLESAGWVCDFMNEYDVRYTKKNWECSFDSQWGMPEFRRLTLDVEIDDLDVWLGELHNTTQIWLFASGRDRTLEYAEMMRAEAEVRAIVGRLRLEVRQLKAIGEQPVKAADLVSALGINPFCDLVGQCEAMRLEIDELRTKFQSAAASS